MCVCKYIDLYICSVCVNILLIYIVYVCKDIGCWVLLILVNKAAEWWRQNSKSNDVTQLKVLEREMIRNVKWSNTTVGKK